MEVPVHGHQASLPVLRQTRHRQVQQNGGDEKTALDKVCQLEALRLEIASFPLPYYKAIIILFHYQYQCMYHHPGNLYL